MKYKLFSLLISIGILLSSVNTQTFSQSNTTSRSKTSINKKLTDLINSNISKITNIGLPNITIDPITKTALSNTPLYTTLNSINKAVAPFLFGQYFIFTYYNTDHTNRVAIAFEHESYSQLHSFVRLKNNPDLIVFALERTYFDQQINYRLIINSNWGIDVQNPDFLVDSRGIQVSTVFIPKGDPLFLPSLVNIDNKYLRFYLYLNPRNIQVFDTNNNEIHFSQIENSAIFLVSSFTNWDPFLVQMTQSPDNKYLYYADLDIPTTGIYHYYFQAGNLNILDPKNETLSKRNVSGDLVNTFQIVQEVKERTGAKLLAVSTKDIYLP